MQALNFLIGIIILLLGIPIGNLLAKLAKDELKQGQKWFKLIVVLSLLGAIIGLILGNDILLFSFAFIAIATSRSLKNEIKDKIKELK